MSHQLWVIVWYLNSNIFKFRATNQLLNMKRLVRKDQVVDQVVNRIIDVRTNQMAAFPNQIVIQNQDQKHQNLDHQVVADHHQKVIKWPSNLSSDQNTFLDSVHSFLFENKILYIQKWCFCIKNDNYLINKRVFGAIVDIFIKHRTCSKT